jgi:hypothetical protein
MSITNISGLYRKLISCFENHINKLLGLNDTLFNCEV